MSGPPRIEVTVLRVFCGEGGSGGNELGVVLDGPSVEGDDRQALAARLGYAETVFVDDAAAGRIAIYAPDAEMPFAGHPTVGTAWLLAREGVVVEALLTAAGKAAVRYERDNAYVAARPEWCPPFELEEQEDAAAVDAHRGVDEGLVYAWAWIDREAGLVRARSFLPAVGIGEDEATGSAALRLCAQVGRKIEVRQGRGSVIHARPLDDGRVEICGSVVAA